MAWAHLAGRAPSHHVERFGGHGPERRQSAVTDLGQLSQDLIAWHRATGLDPGFVGGAERVPDIGRLLIQ